MVSLNALGGSHFTARGWWGTERSCYLTKILTMVPPVEKMHRSSSGRWERWGLHCSPPTEFKAREQDSKQRCKFSKQGGVDPCTKQQLKFGVWERSFSSRAAQRACVVSWAAVVVEGDIWEEKWGGKEVATSGRFSGKQSYAQYLGGLVKREVSVTTIKLGDY